MLSDFIPLVVIVIAVFLSNCFQSTEEALVSFRILDEHRKTVSLIEYESLLWNMAGEAAQLNELQPIGVSNVLMATCSSHTRKADVVVTYKDDVELNYHSSSLLKEFVVIEFANIAKKYEVNNTFTKDVTVNSAISTMDKKVPASDFTKIRGAMRALRNKQIFTPICCKRVASTVYHGEFAGYGLQAWAPVIRKSQEQFDLLSDHLFMVSTVPNVSLGTLAYMTDFYSDYIRNQYNVDEITKFLKLEFVQLLMIIFNIGTLVYLVTNKKILLFYFIIVIASSNLFVIKLIVCTFISIYSLAQHPTELAIGWLQIHA